MSEPYLALQVVMMPRDANPNVGMAVMPGGAHYLLYNTIFGGVLLANIDMAGAIGAQREVQIRGGNSRAAFVTVAINRVEFKKPVLVGDVVKFVTRLVKFGRTSVTIHIDVIAERGAETIPVTEAEAVFVGVDLSTPDRKPVPLFP
jgi:acyl-CoA thioesterase YciA